MKKKVFLAILCFAFSFVQVWGAFTSKTSVIAECKSGEGYVYVSTSKLTKQKGLDSCTTISVTQTQGPAKPKTLHTYYLYTKPANDDFAFKGWSIDGENPIEGSTKDVPYIVTVPTSSLSDTCVTYTALYQKKIYYNVTLISNGTGTMGATDGRDSIKQSQTLHTRDEVCFFTTPNAGYKAAAWYTRNMTNGKKTYFSYAREPKYLFYEDVYVGVDFMPEELPVFVHKETGTPYSDFNKAIKAAKDGGTIIMTSGGSLEKGEYVIPEGVTFAIAFDDDMSYYTDNIKGYFDAEHCTPDKVGYIAPSPYETLTLKKGAHLVVNGTMTVSAKMNACNGGSTIVGGGVYGQYGAVQMDEGSSIEVNSGATLYAWGYVSGEGHVKVNSGATLHEGFQMTAFRGGTATSSMCSGEEFSGKKVFPVNQYYVQNIETPVIFAKGAYDNVRSAVYASENGDANMAKVTVSDPVTFIGEDGLFELDGEDATLTRWYDGHRDRQMYRISGNAHLGNLQVSALGGGISTSGYVVPITNNMSIEVESGTFEAKVNTNGISLLPDAELTIGEDATLALGKGNLYVYDKDDWGRYSCYVDIMPLPYAPSKNADFVRLGENMKDAMLDVRGKITSEGGYIYSTANGGNICCTEGVGTIEFASPEALESVTYQARQARGSEVPEENGTTPHPAEISLTPAKLQQSDGTSVSSVKGTTYYYVHGEWKTENTLPEGVSFGDVYKDGKLDKKDVETLMMLIVNKELTDAAADNVDADNADVNNDGQYTPLDLAKLIEKIKKSESRGQTP